MLGFSFKGCHIAHVTWVLAQSQFNLFKCTRPLLFLNSVMSAALSWWE